MVTFAPSRAVDGRGARSLPRAVAPLAAHPLDGDALAHADQAVAGAGTLAGAWAVVRDLELEVVRAVVIEKAEPAEGTEITLLDPNPNVLERSSRRLAALHPVTVEAT